MKIGILADTHDQMTYTHKATEALNDLRVELVLHAGDYVAPFIVNELSKLTVPLYGIFGNNDGERLGLMKRLSEIGTVQVQPLFLERQGRKIVMVHEPEPVEAFALSGLYDVVIYAHTHEKDLRTMNRCLIINPGEVCGWLTGSPTCAVLDLDDMLCEILEL
ncbi:MAG: metallophosphoesterase [Candidatus Caldarchaeum sp.]